MSDWWYRGQWGAGPAEPSWPSPLWRDPYPLPSLAPRTFPASRPTRRKWWIAACAALTAGGVLAVLISRRTP